LDKVQLDLRTLIVAIPIASNTHILPPSIEISCFLTLPKVPFRSTHQPSTEEPLIHYSNNIMMTNDHSVKVFEQKMACKEVVMKEIKNHKEKMFTSRKA
jgi:hypothetical protein